MVKLSAYDSVIGLLQNDNIFSSFTQNSNKREHKFSGVINDQFFELKETGTPKFAMDKIAKAIASRFGVDGDLSSAAVLEKLGWQMQCWSPAREVYRLREGLFLEFESESDGVTTVACKKRERVEKGAERPDPVVVSSYSANSYADAEHHLAIQVLRSEEYNAKYVENMQERAKSAAEPDFDTMADFGWSLYEDCDEEEEGEYCKTLREFCENMKVDAPQWKKEMMPKNPKEDYKRGVVCMLKISETRDSKEEACKALMEKMDGIIKAQNASAEFYDKQDKAPAAAAATNTISDVKKEELGKQVYDENSIKQLPAEDVAQFPILALNDYVRADSTLGKPVFSDDGTDEVNGTKNFIIKCTVDSVETRARASTKKQAKQLAAQVMIIALKNCGDVPLPVAVVSAPKPAAPAQTFTPKVETQVVGQVAGVAQAAPGTPDTNPISLCTQASQFFKKTLNWNVDDGQGNPPNKIFTAHVEFDGMTAVASAAAKKEAKTLCGQNLLNTLNAQRPGWQDMMKAQKAQKRPAGRGGRGGKQAKTGW